MLHALYTLFVLILLLLTLPWWVIRSLRTGKYRGTMRQRLGFALPKPPVGAAPIWIHAVSVGEVMAAQGLLRALHARYPDSPLLLSTVTKTGQEIARSLPGISATFYLPLDLPWIVRRVLKHLQPRALIVMETELWPNLFQQCKLQQIPVILVNGRLSPRSFRHYRLFRWAMKPFLEPVHLFIMQSAADAERMLALGSDPQRVIHSGNLKYDQALQPPTPAQLQELAERLPPPSGIIWLAASTHPGEEESILDSLQSLRPQWPTLRLILVPRHPERAATVGALIRQTPFQYALFSQLSAPWNEEILLVDQVGWLTRLYRYAHIAFVGGSLIPHGGQNMLEPASQGIPTLFGPHTVNFRQAVQQLLEKQAALQLPDRTALTPTVQQLLADPELRQQLGTRAQAVVASNSGALQRTLQALQPLLDTPPL
ncbi:3-deoxy-D-manno-octulosonic acid transferase [Candidatus Magnetaquicoccus inordinatus]|uniref:3-deoxy-D-manno-octulosonic acid transferase n=1 Tax=Candidatus Magnetaquicoccus inordinatus TaxID=2496818 RepID=UPI00102C379D|nr:3-deoxy-D-manno-octulosonic acid transferase [Candidatus Magnetaquicoccus inordinatus]